MRKQGSVRWTVMTVACMVILSASAALFLCVFLRNGPSKSLEFDAGAVAGKLPDEAYGYAYTVLERDDLPFSVGVAGQPRVSGGRMSIWFHNRDGNDCYLSLQVLDGNGAVLAETGLLRPGEYIESVDAEAASGSDIKMKVFSYEPDTLYSGGSVTLNTTVG